MASIHLTDEHEAFRATVRRFIEHDVAPRADAWEAARRIPRDVFVRMGELGMLGITVPERWGGAGADLFHALVFIEELPRSRMGGFCAAVTVQQFMATQHILRWGSDELRQRYLTGSVAGRLVGALAVTEPDAGSDVAAIRTRAVLDGDHFVVDGAKTFITNGAEGDFLTLAVKTDLDAGAAGISLLVVEADTPGVRVSRRLDKLGWHCSDTAELSFEGVRVPAGNIIGQRNMGFAYLMEAFALERLVGAAIAVGSTALALEIAREHVRARHAFGHPLSRFQALTHRLAQLAAELEAARALSYHTAWLLEQGHAAVAECAMVKLLATELSKRAADEVLQVLGGYGFMEEYPAARFFRDARAGTIVAGTSEIMREIVARALIEGEEPHAGIPAAAEEQARCATRAVDEPAEQASAVVEATVESLVRSLPTRTRPDRLTGWSAVFHFALKGAPQPAWTVRIENGEVTVCEGHEGEPACRIEMAADTYVGIETGRTNPQVAFMMGRVKVSDIGQMMRFIKGFRPARTVDGG